MNASLATGPSVAVVALSCLEPALSMLSAANVARPEASVAVGAPPESVPVPISESETSAPATALPNASCTRTVTAGVTVALTSVVVGCERNASEAWAAGRIANASLPAGVNAPLDAVSLLPAPATVSTRSSKLASPAASVLRVVVPVSVPVPAVSVASTATPDCATALPYASRSCSLNAGAMAAPATVLAGCCVIASCVAAPALTTMPSARVAVSASASAKRTTNEAVPAAVAVPVSAPVPLSRAMPAGSAPSTTVQVYGSVPPVAVTESE